MSESHQYFTLVLAFRMTVNIRVIFRYFVVFHFIVTVHTFLVCIQCAVFCVLVPFHCRPSVLQGVCRPLLQIVAVCSSMYLFTGFTSRQ